MKKKIEQAFKSDKVRKGAASRQKPVKTVKRTAKQDDPNAPVRLNKFLAEAGVGSRRKADELIAQGVVKVNGAVTTELGTKVVKSDFITVNGDPIKEKTNTVYIILNKPKNVLTTSSDDRGRKTVLDIVKKQTRIFPVGRLDRNTTGAILLTNDGELAHRLTHPSYEIERIYIVKLDSEIKFEDAKSISLGVELEDGPTQPCEIDVNPNDKTKLIITLKEGKNREVRRLFEHFGYEVKQLSRKIFAGLSISGLKVGEYRHLTRGEVRKLKKLVKLD